MRKVGYVMHQFRADPSNLDRADRWLRWLQVHYDAYFWAPWIHLCRSGELYSGEREQGLEIDCACIGLSHFCIAVGGNFSVGMLSEAKHARAIGVDVLDWSEFTTPDKVPMRLKLDFERYLAGLR